MGLGRGTRAREEPKMCAHSEYLCRDRQPAVARSFPYAGRNPPAGRVFDGMSSTAIAKFDVLGKRPEPEPRPEPFLERVA